MDKYDRAFGKGVCDPTEPLVVFIGTSLRFSDQIFRVLGLEFPGVRFARVSDPHDLVRGEPRPNVIVVHETVRDLSTQIEEIQNCFVGTMVAVACNDTSAVTKAHLARLRTPVSVLQMNTQLDVWLSVLRLLLCGHVYIPADVLPARANERSTRSASEPGTDSEVEFTPREMQILPLIAEGKQNKMIAGELGLSEHTVKLHTHNIFSKLRVSNRTGAASWYLSQVEGARYGRHDMHTK